MNTLIYNPAADMAVVLMTLKENLRQAVEGKKTFSQALKDTGKMIAILGMIEK